MKILKEFKAFISRGNVIDMAVGIIIGGAFTGIVNSLVKDVIMPLFGFVLGRFDFSNLKWVLIPAAEGMEEVSVTYGVFIQKTVDFLIVAVAIFILIQQLNRFKKKEEVVEEIKEATPSEEVQLLTEIRDLLKEDTDERNQS